MELEETDLVDVRGTLLDRMLRVSRIEIIMGLAAVVLGVVVANGVIPVPYAVVWAGLTMLSYGARFWLSQVQQRSPARDAEIPQRTKLFLATVIATGLCWGVIAAYALKIAGLAPSVPLLLLASATSVFALGAHAGYLPAGLATAAGTTLPPALAMFSEFTRLGSATALGLVALGGTAYYCACLLKQQAWEALSLRERNEKLASYLDQRREQVEKLNVELKTTHGKREQAEVGLRRTAADLGLVQGKAKALAETLERVSPLCQVTGLANRRHFDQLLDSEWRRAARETKVIAIILVDIDEYDDYLASYGRQSTDGLLKRVATLVRGYNRRAGDMGGRYDESKIALMLPGCDARNAGRIAESLRKRIETQGIPHARGKSGEVAAVHLGVAMIKPTRVMRPDELLKRVDAALYEARFQGGNRVVVYQPLNKLRVERWEPARDGPLNEQSLLQKLLVWGYDTTKILMHPGTLVEPELIADDRVLAIGSGELKIEVEGHKLTVKPGDCVFIPQGVELGLEVVGERPVLKFTAAKNK